MPLSVTQKIKLKITRQFLTAGLFLGIIYIFFYYGFTDLSKYIIGAVIGIMLGSLLSFFELFVFARGAKKIKFLWLLLLRTLIYLFSISFVIFNVAALARVIQWDLSYFEVITGPRFINEYLIGGDFSVAVVYSLILAFVVNFIRMISRKMGQGVLISFLSGTYFKPKHQVRIILFLQLKGTKSRMVELGPMKYHKLLSELYHDYTSPIVNHRGIIHEYIDDLIVITWSVNKGIENSNAIRTFYAIEDIIKENEEKYNHQFGFVPKIQGAIHIGSVIRAEIGEIKTQLVLQGDTMNTTARILSHARANDYEFVVSKSLLQMIELPEICGKKEIGLIELKGKEEKMELVALEKNVR